MDSLPCSITTLATLEDDGISNSLGNADDELPPPVLALTENCDELVAVTESAIALLDRRGDRGRRGCQMVRRTAPTAVRTSTVQ